MKAKEIQALSEKELRSKLSEEKLELTRFRMQHAIAQTPNPMQIREGRKTVARLKTEMRKRQIASQNNANA